MPIGIYLGLHMCQCISRLSCDQDLDPSYWLISVTDILGYKSGNLLMTHHGVRGVQFLGLGCLQVLHPPGLSAMDL